MLTRTRAAACLILLLGGVVQFSILPARQRAAAMAGEAQALEEEIGQLRLENSKLAKQVQASKSDPYYVEYLLRERLRYQGPGELRPARERHGRPAPGPEAAPGQPRAAGEQAQLAPR